MLPEIISFNKSREFRLEEYEQLLDGIETPCSDIIEIWGSLLSDLAVIGVNWQALWILSEKNCRQYELLFPTAVIVKVTELDFSELTALVEVIAVQEDILLPSVLGVPLIELHPIKDQNYDETELRDIEDWFDKCRYFFKHLWYPWDAKLDVCLMDWCEAHLEYRLKMQYDLKNGVFDKITANYLEFLLKEAQNIDISNEEDILEEDARILAVGKYIRKENLKIELDLFEEPYLRSGIIHYKKRERPSGNSVECGMQEAKLIWTKGSCEGLLQYIMKVQSLLDRNTQVKVFGCLQQALDLSNTNDVIVLSPGKHEIISLKGIGKGGTIKGWDKCRTQIIPDASVISKLILLECFAYVQLENLSILKSSGIAIQVFNGTVKLTKCRLVSKKNSTSKGIVVVSGSKLILEKCEIEGFGTGIAVQAEAQASLFDSEIRNCFEGIKVTENAKLQLEKANICFNYNYGIRVESSKVQSPIPVVGDLNLLEGDHLGCQVTAHLVNLTLNLKGNVIVKQIEEVFNAEEFSEFRIVSEVLCLNDGETSGNDSI